VGVKLAVTAQWQLLIGGGGGGKSNRPCYFFKRNSNIL